MGQSNRIGRSRDTITFGKQRKNQHQTNLTNNLDNDIPSFYRRRNRYMNTRQVTWLSIPMTGDPVLSDYKNLPEDNDTGEFYLGENSCLISHKTDPRSKKPNPKP